MKIEPDRPYSVSLASATASSSSSKGITATTGPNTSSRQIRLVGRRRLDHRRRQPEAVAVRASSPANATVDARRGSACTESLLAAPRPSAPSRCPRRVGSSTRMPRTAVSRRPRNSSYADRSTRIRERAQQSWPALSKTAYGAAAAAAATSASAKTMLALLPPSSRVTRFTCSAQPAMICLPTSVEPVKQTLRTSGWVTKRSPTTEPLPGMTVSTPSGGRPRARARRSGSRSAA